MKQITKKYIKYLHFNENNVLQTPNHKRQNMQSLLMYIQRKGEYIKMAPSAIYIRNKIHNQRGSK
jgi:hypothetical protein